MITDNTTINVISILRDMPDEEDYSRVAENSYSVRNKEKLHQLLMVYGLLG